jgi:hypothetical protein
MKLDGKEVSELIAYARDHCLKTTKGNEFTTSLQINNILRDKRCVGIMEHEKTYMNHNQGGKRNIVNDCDKPKYIIKNHHEVIIDEDIFNQVQELINSQTRKHHLQEKNPFT